MNLDRATLLRLGAFLLGVALLLVVVGVASNSEEFATSDNDTPSPRYILPIEEGIRPGVDDQVEGEAEEEREPINLPDWIPLVVWGAAILGFLYFLSKQRFSFRFRRPNINIARTEKVKMTEEEQADQIASIARDLIDELNDSDDARLAIQRAYAAVETGFGAKELERHAAETPLKYLSRIFGRHASVEEPLRRLTDLFQWARFSDEPVDEPMRQQAIAALGEIRDYYQNYSWSKIQRKAEARR